MREEYRRFLTIHSLQNLFKKTGTGLSISRHIGEETESGSLTCSSPLGEGMELAIAIHLE
ncbi:hypothetical protein QUA82_10320 [Microcoleus sp. F8-D3]